MMPLTMRDALRVNARTFPTKVALRDEQRAYTYPELEARTNRLARWLLSLGLKRGNLLAVALGNRLEYPEVVYAAAKAGVATVPMDVRWGPVELESMARFFDAPAAVVDASLLAPGGPLERRALWPAERTIVVGGPPDGANAYETGLARFPDSDPGVEVSENDLFMLMLTSGTTGVPKACVATHRTFTLRTLNYAMGGDCALTADDLYLATLPLYFNAGRGFLLGVLYHGASAVVMPRFDPHATLRAIGQYRATTLYLVPTMCERLLAALRERPYAVDSVRVIRTTGSALHETTRRGLAEFFRCEIADGYGSTDCSSIARPRRGEQPSPPGSVGRPTWGTEIGIFDDDGRELPAGEQGEICVRGPLVCDGYYKNPQANAASFRDGWFLTGDVGYLDRDGFLYVTGRKKNMVKSGGVSIYPEEIEEVLKRHPEVLEAAVVGLPDARWGEAVHAAVVPARGAQPEPEALIAHCKQHLAPYKAPKTVTLVAELPLTSVGKLDRAAVRRLLSGERSKESTA